MMTTFDKSVYYKIPQELQSSKLEIYQPIVENSQNNAFITYIKNQLKDGYDNNWSRH